MEKTKKMPEYDIGYVYSSTDAGKDLCIISTRDIPDHNDQIVLNGVVATILENLKESDLEKIYSESCFDFDEKIEEGFILYKIILNSRNLSSSESTLNKTPGYLLRVFDRTYKNNEMMMLINGSAVSSYWNSEYRDDPDVEYPKWMKTVIEHEKNNR